MILKILVLIVTGLNCQILDKLQSDQKYTLLHTFKEESIQQIIDKVQQKLSDIIDFKFLDCDKEKDQICFQRASIWTISSKKIDQFNDTVNYQSLLQFVKNNLPDQAQTLKDKAQFDQFLNKYENKVILFSDKTDSGFLFKNLQIKLKDKFQFAIVPKENQEIVKQYNILAFPKLLLINKDFDEIFYQNKNDFDSIYEFLTNQANLQKLNNLVDFSDYVMQEEEIVLIFVYVKDEQNKLTEIQKKFGKMIKYFGFQVIFKYQKVKDEETRKFALNKLKSPRIPQLIFYPFSIESKKNPIYLQTSISIEDFIETVNQNTQDGSIMLSGINFQREMNQGFSENKVVLILFQEKETPLSYRVISQLEFYKQFFYFGQFRNAPQEILTQFGVTKLPTLVILASQPQKDSSENKVSIIQYPGKIHYNQLTSFFSRVIGYQEQKQQLKVIKVESQQQLQEGCNTQVCFIGLVNGEDDEKLLQQSLILKKLRKDNPSEAIQFIQIDSTCHPEISAQIEIDQTPYLFAYLPNKLQIVQMFGTFENESLSLFVKKVLTGKVTTQSLKQKLEITEKDCQEIHRQAIFKIDL